MEFAFIPAIALVAAAVLIVLQMRRIDLLRQENQRLARRALEVDQMKKDLISHVSHELKAPLASMQETTHLVVEKIPGPLTEKQQRLLELNLQSGKRLSAMIGNLLDLSRLRAGIVEYEMHDLDIADLIRSVITELQVQTSDKAMRILTDIQNEPLIVNCDRNRMVQLFTNLIENALRFSTRDGFVKLHVISTRNLPERMPAGSRRVVTPRATNGYALVAISDCGPGIEDVHKEKVFDEFHQVKQGGKTLGQGFGLGLAISRSVVQAHCGTIWVEDNPGGGSIFFVMMPRAAAKAESLREVS